MLDRPRWYVLQVLTGNEEDISRELCMESQGLSGYWETGAYQSLSQQRRSNIGHTETGKYLVSIKRTMAAGTSWMAL